MVDKRLVRLRRTDGVVQGYWVNTDKRPKRKKIFMKKRIVIGGPPHSGKSTFMTLLERRMEKMGIDVKLIDLDYASPTIEWLKGVEDDREKRPWTPELAREARRDFLDSSKKTDVILGDSPGRITNITRTLVRGADGAIVLSKDKKSSRKWRNFFRKMKVPVITTLDSKLFGDSWYSPRKNKGRATNLKRSELRKRMINDRNIAVQGVAFEIAQHFGITLT